MICVIFLDSKTEAQNAYQTATDLAGKKMAPTNSIRLGLALNYSVFHYEIGTNPDEACKLAKSVSRQNFKHLEHCVVCRHLMMLLPSWIS